MANNAEQLLEAQLKASMVSNDTSSDYNSGSKKLLIDLLYDKFGADDLVKIKNFTDKPTGWVYSDKKSLKIEQPNEFTRRVWQGEQKTRVLKAGETVIVPGWEAYVGLNRFFNQYIQDNFPGELSIRMNSPIEHEKFVKKAFAGIYDPNEPEETKDVKAEVEDDLGLVPKSEVKEGEKAKAK
jgi:hypothetical protein